MPALPRLTSGLVQRATDPLIAGFSDGLAKEQETEAHRMGDLVRQLVVRAYQEGVRDGFVQGCEAQANSEGADRAAA